MRIAIVDDNERWVDFATRVLLDAGHEVVVENPDVVFLSSLKLEDAPDGKFVVFSGSPNTKEASMAYRIGALNYKAKDFRELELLRVIDGKERL